MVEILNRGIPPAEKLFDVTCPNCASELRFTRGEAVLYSDWREGDYLHITCPVCRHSVTKGLRS